MADVARGRVDDAVIAFTAERAAELADVSVARVLRLERLGLVKPSTHHRISARNTVRLYDFTDVQALIIVVLLQDNRLSLAHIKQVIEHLQIEKGYEHPLKELKFAVVGHKIYFKHPDGSWEGEDKRDQIVIEQTIRIDAIKAKIRRAASQARSEAEVGQVERRRRALGSKQVFKRTRIPVEGVVEFVRAGADDRQILEAFPRLKPEDVQLARELAKAS